MGDSGDGPDVYKYKRGSDLNQPQPYSGIPDDEYNDGRDEKPWQRVPSPLILVVLGLYLLLGFLTQVIEDDMPAVVSDASVSRDDWQTFSEEAALRYLHTILGGQPRVAGTQFHLQKTQDLKDLVDRVTAEARLPVKTDWQMVTGNFWMNFSVPFVNYYQNASNIVAVLEGESGFNPDGSTRSSLLVNCHYDSVPFAQGASDNGVFCAAMVETLSRLSRRNTKFKHNIIFLFNGAEENPLQGSHAFLQHPWARGVSAVINLDSAGMNGKPSVFQVTDPRVLSAYSRGTPRPSAQGVGEFLFMSGIIPSDTDFRIWRDFGHIQGIDIAFTKWGHVYHTRNDRPDLILPGVLQGAGDMLLGVVGAAGDMDLENKMPPTRMVYFDYLNIFVVSYSYLVSHILDAIVALFALLSVMYYIWLVGMRWSTVQELLWALLGRVCCLIGGLLLVAALVPIMVATTTQLRYLSKPWIVVPLYWVPYLVGTVVVAHLFDAWRTKKSGLNRSIRTLQAMAATRLLLAAVLTAMTCVPSLSGLRYVVAVPLFTMSAAALVSLTVVRYQRMAGWHHLLMEFFLSIPSAMFMLMLSLRLDAMMLPIMGRSAGSNPDYTVAMINVGMAVLTCVTVSGTELLFSRRRLWLVLGAIFAACVVIAFVPFSPYQDDGPSTQRHYWFHSEIVSYNAQKEVISRTSGVLITKQDAYSTSRVRDMLRDSNIHVNLRQDFNEDCERQVYCGLPVYRVAFGRALQESLFLYTEPPARFEPAPDVNLIGKSCIAENCTYSFEVTVAPHNLFTFWPRDQTRLLSWSLTQPARASFPLRARNVSVVMHSAATYSKPLELLRFNLTLHVPTSLQSSPALDLSHHAHLAQHPERFTQQYSSLLKAAPPYFNVATFLSVRSNYIF